MARPCSTRVEPCQAGPSGTPRSSGRGRADRSIALPGSLVGAALERDVGNRHAIGHERIEEPAPPGSLSFSSNSRRIARSFLRSSMPSRIVRPTAPRPSGPHHLRADIERGEQRIERRRRGVQHEAFVEPPVLDARRWPLMWRSRTWICEAWEKLASCLCADWVAMIPGELSSRSLSPMANRPLVERMEFHEARPGLVEQDIVAQMPDALDDPLGVVDRAVIGALLDHRDAERPLALQASGSLISGLARMLSRIAVCRVPRDKSGR